MMATVKNICFYIVLSVSINFVSLELESKFLIKFLEGNLITLLVALLAINTTTMSIVMVKLRELKDKFGVNFDNTLSSLRISVYEQVSLIPLSIFVLVVRDSSTITTCLKHSQFALDTLLIATFTYAVHILFDNARAVFIIITTENNM